jgi:hypothetical protein
MIARHRVNVSGPNSRGRVFHHRYLVAELGSVSGRHFDTGRPDAQSPTGKRSTTCSTLTPSKAITLNNCTGRRSLRVRAHTGPRDAALSL